MVFYSEVYISIYIEFNTYIHNNECMYLDESWLDKRERERQERRLMSCFHLIGGSSSNSFSVILNPPMKLTNTIFIVTSPKVSYNFLQMLCSEYFTFHTCKTFKAAQNYCANQVF